jgi:hypothetical protein
MGDETIGKLAPKVKFWFGILPVPEMKNPGSRRQGGGGGEPR